MAPGDQLSLVRSRAREVRTLTALVEVALDTPRRSGTIEILSVYERPGRLFLSASRGFLLSERPLFELTFTRTHHRLDLFEEDEGIRRHEGRLEDFPLEHPDLSGLFWVREAMFLPGDLIGGKTRDGAEVELELDPETLAVLAATLRPPDGSSTIYRIQYDDYRRVGTSAESVILPHEVRVMDASGDFRMAGRVVRVEANEELPPDSFGILEDG